MWLVGLICFPSFPQETRVQLQEELFINIMTTSHTGDNVCVRPIKNDENILMEEATVWGVRGGMCLAGDSEDIRKSAIYEA